MQAVAQALGINTAYEVPPDQGQSAAREGKHTDDRLQTLLFPADLEARLRKLRRKARTALEESGENFLYLALGFLEWFDANDSDKPRLAPLVLVPVDLSAMTLPKGSEARTCQLTYTESDFSTNVSLSEKLRVDFGITLPEINFSALEEGAVEEFSVERYFAAVAEAVESKPQWRVRRYASLGFFQFSNIFLWKDLDPKAGVFDDSLVKRLYDGERIKEAVVAVSDIAQIDERTTPCLLAVDADSSQHAAIETVFGGTNLVIEGPPGTGKSQTIVNIIGASLAAGKSVLFVSEKLAALEVVRRKMDAAGLGVFCLELHSNKTNKRALLEDVNERLMLVADHEAAGSAHELAERLEAEKASLAEYSRAWTAPLVEGGPALGEVLASEVRWRTTLLTELGQEEIPRRWLVPRLSNLAAPSEDWFEASVHLLQGYTLARRDYATQLVEGRHPWAFVTSPDIAELAEPRIIASVEDLAASLDSLDGLRSCEDELGLRFSNEISVLRALIETIRTLPQAASDDVLQLVPRLTTEQELQAAETLLEEVAAHQQEAAGSVEVLGGRPGIEDRMFNFVTAVGQANIEAHSQQSLLKRIAALRSSCAQLAENRSWLEEFAGIFGETFLLTPARVRRLRPALEVALKIPARIPSGAGTDLRAPELQSELRVAQAAQEKILESRDWLSSNFTTQPDPTHAIQVAEVLSRTTWYSCLFPRWNRARKYFLSVWSGPPLLSPRDEAASLRRAVDAQDAQKQLQGQTAVKRLLDGQARVSQVDIGSLLELADWQAQLERELGNYPELLERLVVLDAATLTRLKELAPGATLAQKALQEAVSVFGTTLDGSDFNQILSHGAQASESWGAFAAAIAESRAPAEMTVADILATQQVARSWLSKAGALEQEVGRLFGVQSQLAQTNEILKPALDYCHALLRASVRDDVAHSLRSFPHIARLSRLREFAEQLEASIAHATKSFLQLGSVAGNIAEKDFSLHAPEGVLEGNYSWARRELALALNRRLSLKGRIALRRALVATAKGGLDEVRELLDEEVITDSTVDPYLRWRRSRDALDQSKEVESFLSQFDGAGLEEVRRRFKQLDLDLREARIAQIRHQVASRGIPQGESSSRVANLTELALIKHEISKKVRHVPVRALIGRAGGALRALKPCFMMGPLAVPHYLERSLEKFDLLIVDEASQVRAEHALSAVARAKQIVVVGDSKQLPPSRFFEQMDDAEEEDDQQVRLEQHESLLSAARDVLPAQDLRWHYRSRHESLIQFSNHAFYNNRLIVFPSPSFGDSSVGVQHRAVQGVFEGGKNVIEARAVCELVFDHMKFSPDRSLGVVAMNLAQANYIEDLVERGIAHDLVALDFVQKWKDRGEPFFVKNLENVQGDERDDIMISFTYGPHHIGGEVPQRFPLINQQDGWRRLNVLYTRAKQRVVAFASFRSAHVHAPSGRRGLEALRDYLQFAETGILPSAAETSRGPESDFEIAVADVIQKLGYETVFQVGVAGFFIDIAIRDPKDGTRYLLAVECDGAPYHSLKVARDRDRIRQTVLEGYGWKFHRIWSTDWFDNPTREARKLKELLARMLTSS